MQPGQQKITQFDRVNNTQAGDIIPIVRGGQNKSITVEDFTGVLPEGWITPAEAWTFSSFGNGIGVITVPEGNINRYPNGTRVWFKQGTPTATNRYGVVIASTTTTLTVAMIAGTELSNLTIQQPAISSEVAPRTTENVDFTNLTGLSVFSRSSTTSLTFTVAVRSRVTAYGSARTSSGTTNSFRVTLSGGTIINETYVETSQDRQYVLVTSVRYALVEPGTYTLTLTASGGTRDQQNLAVMTEPDL